MPIATIPTLAIPTAYEALRTYAYMPHDKDVTVPNIDYYITKKRLDNVQKRLASGDITKADIPMQLGLHRAAIPLNQLNEGALTHLGYKPARVAIPEAGQTSMVTYRNPINNLHIHRHKDYWTVHQDKHTPLSMVKEKAKVTKSDVKFKDVINGVRHVVQEGIPGGLNYLKGKILDSDPMDKFLALNKPKKTFPIPITTVESKSKNR